MINFIFKILIFFLSILIVYMIYINVNDYVLLNNSNNYEMDLEITANYATATIIFLLLIDIGLIVFVKRKTKQKRHG